MAPELSLEQLAAKLDEINKTANVLIKDVQEMKQGSKGETEEEKKARIAQEEEEEKKEALKAKRAKRDAAIKAAMEEEDEEKRDAALRAAMDEHDHKEHKAEHEPTEKEKEEQASVASIINDKRKEFIDKILSANKIFNPTNLKAVEERIKTANLQKLQEEYETIKPFIAAHNLQQEQKPADQPFIPYFASIMNPDDIDASQLNANSPDSAFNKLTTKELLEMTK